MPLMLQDPPLIRRALIAGALLVLGILLVVPLAAVFTEALRLGLGTALTALTEPDALHAILLTVLMAAICVPLNLVFGLAASWAVAKHDFWGKSLLVTLIDLPFSVSPVIAGLMLVTVFGVHSFLGGLLEGWGLQVIFALPGMVLATLFITFPFVARELIPAMQATGREEEQAAYLLGANGWQILWRVTLPNVRWALLYGVLLCNARAMGEFGAVSVVSGHIRGETNTIPLQVEILYNEYNFVAAFALAAVLTLLALLTLSAKSVIEWQVRRQRAHPEAERLTNRVPLHQLPR